MSSFDGSLDAEQRAAVFADERRIAVLAGPGSGKTRTLSHRARFLLESGASTEHALLLTFTNKAAAEMKARALSFSVSCGRLYGSTFHTFCADVLRAHGSAVGAPNDFEILDRDETTQLASEAAALAQTRNLRESWSICRLRRHSPGGDVGRFGANFQQLKQRDAVVDFDDLIVGVADLFKANDDIVAAYAARYRHVLVDEFQDTNAAQSEIIERLGVHAKTVSVFADDDQAIFHFAGAHARNVEIFIRSSGARVFPLSINYRSCEEIVKVANALISTAPSASGRVMRASRSGGSVTFRTFDTAHQEAEDVANAIALRLAAGVPPADMAVLVRSSWRADLMAEVGRARRLPINDWRAEATTLGPRRLLSACLTVIRGRMGARAARSLCELMQVTPASTTVIGTDAFLAAHGAHPFARKLSEMKDLAFSGASPQAIVATARDAVATCDVALATTLDELVAAVGSFQSYDPAFTLEHLLSELALGSIGRPPAAGGGIKLATLHKTKGLQWKLVFLLGLEDECFPDRRSFASDNDLLEELRLCFVGVSRAEEELVITYTKTTPSFQPRTPSRFLRNMGILPS